MRRSIYSDAEILGFVRELEAGRPADEICRASAISLRTLYRWRRQFGGLKPFAAQALRRLEQENRRLKAEVTRYAESNPVAVRPPAAVIRSDLGSGSVFGSLHRSPPTVIGRYASLRVR